MDNDTRKFTPRRWFKAALPIIIVSLLFFVPVYPLIASGQTGGAAAVGFFGLFMLTVGVGMGTKPGVSYRIDSRGLTISTLSHRLTLPFDHILAAYHAAPEAAGALVSRYYEASVGGENSGNIAAWYRGNGLYGWFTAWVSFAVSTTVGGRGNSLAGISSWKVNWEGDCLLIIPRGSALFVITPADSAAAADALRLKGIGVDPLTDSGDVDTVPGPHELMSQGIPPTRGLAKPLGYALRMSPVLFLLGILPALYYGGYLSGDGPYPAVQSPEQATSAWPEDFNLSPGLVWQWESDDSLYLLVPPEELEAAELAGEVTSRMYRHFAAFAVVVDVHMNGEDAGYRKIRYSDVSEIGALIALNAEMRFTGKTEYQGRDYYSYRIEGEALKDSAVPAAQRLLGER
jgi:hypothetical protein